MSFHRARESPSSGGPWVGKVPENVLEQGRFRQDLRKRIRVPRYVEKQAHPKRAEGDLSVEFGCALCVP